jgi:hypothetical protein
MNWRRPKLDVDGGKFKGMGLWFGLRGLGHR